MNKTVNCCFTSGKVEPFNLLDTYIDEVDKALKTIDNICETLKIHIILTHVKESLQYIENNVALGFWSEQSEKAIHCIFLCFRSNIR